ncbi:MAG: hypothetical protein ACSHWU_03955 [Marinicella sp.]
MKQIKRTIFFFIIAITGSSEAVNINQKKVGEVLVYPYYTVNNNINTIYTIVNTTSDTKALKIRFLESQHSRPVLSFNIYLGGYDMWVGNLSAIPSSVFGHSGEPSALHTTEDNSCAPFLNKSGQEFLPFEIDLDFANNNLQRATEGHIEVIEMGTVTGSSQAAIDLGSTGVPNDCGQIATAWDGSGYWFNDSTVDMLPATGGLTGSGTILNIMEGTATGYDALALENFWQGTESHTEPGSLVPHIGSAFPVSQVLDNGTLTVSNWLFGIEAVSATLMQQKIYNEYDITPFLAGKTEWVFTYPTKFFHTNNFQAIPPFERLWNGFDACEDHRLDIWDQQEFRAPTANFSSCYSVNVLEFLGPGQSPGAISQLLGSNNSISVMAIDNDAATEAGWASITLDGAGQNMLDPAEIKYSGLPVVGFMLHSYINAGAPVGVLAAYSGLFPHKTEPKIGQVVDLIFAHSFEAP